MRWWLCASDNLTEGHPSHGTLSFVSQEPPHTTRDCTDTTTTLGVLRSSQKLITGKSGGIAALATPDQQQVKTKEVLYISKGSNTAAPCYRLSCGQKYSEKGKKKKKKKDVTVYKQGAVREQNALLVGVCRFCSET